MSNSAIFNTRPRIIRTGVRTETKSVPLNPIVLAQHLPWVFLHTETGDKVQLIDSGSIPTVYGDLTLDPNSDYYNHQSVVASVFAKNNNPMTVVPFKMPDAKQATLRISAIIGAVSIEDPATPGTYINKYKIQWVAEELSDVTDYGKATKVEDPVGGATTSTGSTTAFATLIDPATGDQYASKTIKFPIMDTVKDFKGASGSNYGFSIYAPTTNDIANRADENLAYRLNAMVYYLSVATKKPGDTTFNVIKTVTASDLTPFTLKSESFDPSSGVNYTFEEVIIDSYDRNKDNPDTPLVSPPINSPYLYYDDIDELLLMVSKGGTVDGSGAVSGNTKTFTIPGLYADDITAVDKMYHTNIFTGHDIAGVEHPNLVIEQSLIFPDSFKWGINSFVRLKGGDDGFVRKPNGSIDKLKTLQYFDEFVSQWCDSYDEFNPIFDEARYPSNFIWDSGFSLETKYDLMKPLGKTKVSVPVLTTFSVADWHDPVAKDYFVYQKPLTLQEEVARSSLLHNRVLIYPESEVFGTTTCRSSIFAHSGVLLDDVLYRGRLPLTIAVAEKISACCGATNEVMRVAESIDSGSNKIEDMFTDVTPDYIPDTIKNKLWAKGVNWLETYNASNTKYFPAYQTVYKDASSLLNNLISLVAIVHSQRIGGDVFRLIENDLTISTSKYTEKATAELTKRLPPSKFGNRFGIEIVTTISDFDKQTGVGWTSTVTFTGPSAKNVNTFIISV